MSSTRLFFEAEEHHDTAMPNITWDVGKYALLALLALHMASPITLRIHRRAHRRFHVLYSTQDSYRDKWGILNKCAAISASPVFFVLSFFAAWPLEALLLTLCAVQDKVFRLLRFLLRCGASASGEESREEEEEENRHGH